ncbi:MAG: AzlC family ABC transporter permease [Oscillospiraceae bacterium]|nr:AzlC family ABC transporter permease [Oscillospiraceae bacterium]MBQ2998189.1 AzlC family ABC transporter permease [Oscillospiraceae bacterium]
MKKDFIKGIRDGFPICLGYLSVSFGFGILATGLGLSVLAAVGISLTNLTSAGQAAGVGIIAAGGSLIEMALTQFIINIRYSLMGISLSQKLDGNFNTLHRLVASFGITDEIFAVAVAQPSVSPYYMYGLTVISALGWVLGTFLGAAAGNILPSSVSSALGIVLYGMFLAIIIPPAKKSKGVLTAVFAAAALSIVFKYVLTAVSGGFAIIICAVLSAALCAVLFPVADEEKEAE